MGSQGKNYLLKRIGFVVGKYTKCYVSLERQLLWQQAEPVGMDSQPKQTSIWNSSLAGPKEIGSLQAPCF
jgi:hypothetical protein